MSKSYIPQVLRQAVTERCQHRCSYCQTAQLVTGAEFTLDHIIPESLGGSTTLDNLCLACWGCNLIKRDRISAIDPKSGAMVRLYDPNTQVWSDHFRWAKDGLRIIGLTAAGRATINAVQLNRTSLTDSRRLWVSAGWHPPGE